MRFFFLFSFLLFVFTGPAFAACSTPAGVEGDQFYNTTYSVMQFCNGTNWVNMGAMGGGADNLGDHTATQALNMGGYGITSAAGVQVGNSTTCGAGQAGTIRYVGGVTPWEYCTGSAWAPFKQPRCGDNSTTECYLSATRSTDDPEFTAANIKSGVNILGVTGSYAGGGGSGACDPSEIVVFNDTATSSSLWKQGGYIFAAQGTTGLSALSFNGTTFTPITTYNTTGSATSVWGDGTYIYVADDTSGVSAFTFNGTAFTHIATYNTTGNAKDVWGDGTHIYVADGTSGVSALTFNGTAWTFKATYNTPNDALQVWGDGTYIYVADDNGGLRALSFNGTAWTSLAVWNTTGSLFVGGGGGYIYTGDYRLHALTFNGTTFTSVGNKDMASNGNEIHVQGSNLYIAHYGGTAVYSFNGSSFTYVNNFLYSGEAVYSDGTYIYASDGSGNIFVHAACT
jgi:hypothetical protein